MVPNGSHEILSIAESNCLVKNNTFINTPDWVKHAIFYQIFPDRFAIGQPSKGESQVSVDASSSSEPVLTGLPIAPTAAASTKDIPWEPWDAPPTYQGYKGGNLWGVIERLDYLQSLGITAIYMTPIFQSACNHRYHTHDYYQVDPLLGGNFALLALLEAAHRRGMRGVLDGGFNHASRGFFPFHDILENGPHSPWLDWFKVEGWPLSAYDGSKPANYRGWAGNRALPEFNHDNPAPREYIMQVAEYWLKAGIDGWRLDVPFEIKTPGFWQEFRDRVKAVNPDAYIVGEIWTDARAWLDGTQFDGVMNYLFTGPTIAFTAGDRVQREYVQDRSYEPYPALDAPGYAAKIQALLELYPWEIQLTQLNLLNSHDTARLITIAGGDRASMALANLLLFTFPGAPSIYYGDEVGLPGGLDPDCRRGFPPEANWDLEVLDQHRQLIALRQAHPALRTGTYRVLLAQGLVYVFLRELRADRAIVALNSGTETATAHLTWPAAESPPTLSYGKANTIWQPETNQIILTIPPRTGCVLT